jgi:hypothetical protein
MQARSPFRLYLRSRLNAIVAAASGVLLVAGLVFFRGNAAAAIAGALVVYAAATAALFFSRRGAREVVAKRDEDTRAANLAKVEEAAKARERLAVMRLGDEEVRRGVELVLLVSGQYIEKAREVGMYSPRANDAIRRALEICQAFVGELDEQSTEHRYGTADGDEAANVRGRSIEALKGCAAEIRARSLDDLGGADGTEQLAVIEEMEERK